MRFISSLGRCKMSPSHSRGDGDGPLPATLRLRQWWWRSRGSGGDILQKHVQFQQWAGRVRLSYCTWSMPKWCQKDMVDSWLLAHRSNCVAWGTLCHAITFLAQSLCRKKCNAKIVRDNSHSLRVAAVEYLQQSEAIWVVPLLNTIMSHTTEDHSNY